jgi:hypothetical protein
MVNRGSLSDAEILRRIPSARERDREQRELGLRAVNAYYDPVEDLIMVETTNGFRWGIPRARIAVLKDAPANELGEVSLSPSGEGLHWESLDVQLSIPSLLIDSLGAATLAKELARRGGKVTTASKSAASRRNGAKGGRPSNNVQHDQIGGKIVTSKKGPSVHVVPSKTQPGRFVVKEAGKSQPITRPATQSQSISKAIPIAKHNKSEVIIHGRDGKIRDSDSYGRDPNPPRDKKH